MEQGEGSETDGPVVLSNKRLIKVAEEWVVSTQSFETGLLQLAERADQHPFQEEDHLLAQEAKALARDFAEFVTKIRTRLPRRTAESA